jgi:biopolymer transport protein TolR
VKSHLHGPISEINMTPFVDIVLVILIVFLLTATVLMPRTFSIALPRATRADKMEKIPIIISIDRAGQIAINGVRLARDAEFEQVFKGQQRHNESLAVIAADKETKHGRLMEVIDRLKCLQVQRIGIEVEQR